MAIVNHHATDLDVGGGRIQRKIGNFRNWRNSAGIWSPSSDAVADANETPVDWSGPAYSFGGGLQNSPLQTYFYDKSDRNNGAAWGSRLSDKPTSWVVFKLLNAAAHRLLTISR